MVTVRKAGRNKWHGPGGSRVWIERMKMPHPEIRDREAVQAKMHVRVPEEMRGKGIGSGMLRTVVEELERENITLPAGEKVYRAFVEFNEYHHDDEANPRAAATYEKAGFTGWDEGLFFEKKLANFE